MSAGPSSSSLRWANGSIVLVFCFSLGLLFLVMSRQDAVLLDDILPNTTNDNNDNSHHHHQQQSSKHSFRGTYFEPEVLWAPTYRVASYHYQIAADEGPSHCAGKKYTWEACPGPNPSHINATLQHGMCVFPLFSLSLLPTHHYTTTPDTFLTYRTMMYVVVLLATQPPQIRAALPSRRGGPLLGRHPRQWHAVERIPWASR